MHDRIARGELALGTLMTTHGAELVEIVGYSGLDFVCIDLMTTSLDWGDVASMVLAAKRYDVTPWVRLPAYPWAGDQPDPALPAEALRALAIGAECVMASVNTAAGVEQLMRPMENAHRRFYIMQGRPMERPSRPASMRSSRRTGSSRASRAAPRSTTSTRSSTFPGSSRSTSAWAI